MFHLAKASFSFLITEKGATPKTMQSTNKNHSVRKETVNLDPSLLNFNRCFLKFLGEKFIILAKFFHNGPSKSRGRQFLKNLN